MKTNLFKYSRLIYRPRPFLLAWTSFFFISVYILPIGHSAAGDLRKILPAHSALGDLKPVGGPQEVEGNKLFDLINGGAVIFFKHNFRRALFREYTLGGSKSINLEIYQMGSPQDAKGIYTIKKEKGGEKLPFGEEGFLFEYFCMLRQGPYFVSITGADATDVVRKALTSIAQQVISNIKEGC